MWPDDHQSAIAFTFDLDAEALWLGEDLEEDDAVLRSQGRFAAQVAVPAILELLERHDVLATFFVVGTVAEAYPHVVSEIVDAGHEIGAHGYTHRRPLDLSTKERAAELERATEVLGRFGAELKGYRAPGWSMPARAVNEIHEHGFTYASNLMDDVRPYRHRGSDLVEVPVHWSLDDAPYLLFDARDWTGGYQPNSAIREVWQDEIRAIDALGGVSVLTMHPQLIGRPGRLVLLDEMLTFARELDGAWVATCAEIADSVE